jgi:hypothetical protein
LTPPTECAILAVDHAVCSSRREVEGFGTQNRIIVVLIEATGRERRETGSGEGKEVVCSVQNVRMAPGT